MTYVPEIDGEKLTDNSFLDKTSEDISVHILENILQVFMTTTLNLNNSEYILFKAMLGIYSTLYSTTR